MPRASTAGMGRADRRDAVRALVEHSWVDPEAPRTAPRPHWVLLAAALAAGGALGGGAVAQMMDPIPLAKAAPAPQAPTLASYTAVSGWDCPNTADHGFAMTGRTSAWYTVAGGGWAQDGCHGTFEAMPMTGVADKDDSSQYAVWWFTPGGAVATCTVSVYRPVPDRPQDAAATAAQYWVLAGRSGAPLAGFVLDQTAQPGSWTAVGTYPVNPDGIAVQLVDRGVPATAASRLAVTQVRVQCGA
jgi:hypothetical protein